MSDTVKIRISIEISSDSVCDTGLTVAQWNALSSEAQAEIMRQMWNEEAASNDSGGISVVTAGTESA